MITDRQKNKANELRHDFGTADKKRDEGLETPKGVKRFDDIFYGADSDKERYGKEQILDLYVPEEKFLKEEKLPVIISVHGGGWVYGDKEVYQYYCMSLAERGFAVVNYTYRLAPENKYPAAIEDTDSIFRWVKKNSDKYGLDTENVFALGDSAGAQILASYCCMLTDKEYAKDNGVEVQKAVFPNAIALNCGKYRMYALDIKRDESTEELVECILEEVTEEKRMLLSPLHFVNKDFPKTYLMSATDDFLLDEFYVMKDKLEETGIEHVAKVYEDGKSPLYHVFHCDVRSEIAGKCNDEECEFFRRYIH